ncbi:MAG: septum formation initiator family protein [Bacteroidaceae bacterium]|nr:septum formation initiator family protein [Bacteroidaceae bacterium]
MSRLFSSLWSFVRRNKYVVVLVAFLLIIVVLDQNSQLRRMSLKREMKALQEEIDDYKRQIREGEALLETLESDSMLLEQIARERYNMSRSDEDVFIME